MVMIMQLIVIMAALMIIVLMMMDKVEDVGWALRDLGGSLRHGDCEETLTIQLPKDDGGWNSKLAEDKYSFTSMQ